MITITPTIEGSYTIIRLKGRLDSTTSPELDNYLVSNDFSKYRGIVLEMTELDYISSAGLRVLLNASKAFKKEQIRFLLCGMQAHITEIFEISGFDTFLEIHTTLQKALQQCN